MSLEDYFVVNKLLEKHGIHGVRAKYVKSAAEAVSFAAGDDVVLKLISDKALHKSKAGLVKLGLRGSREIESAYADLVRKGASLKPYKIMVQEMAAPGVEIIIGGNTDAQFGKTILLGLGGIYVETFKDFALRVCPITKYDAECMVEQLRSKNVVTYNGKAKEKIVKLLLSASSMFCDTDAKELDLNPVIVRENGYDVVDIRLLR